MEIAQAFKFCPRCGASFAKKDKHLQCPACGLSFYLNPKPATSVILRNTKGEYLFAVRARQPRRGYLDLPGGFVDDGEDFETAARREIKEELGIELGGLEYFASYTNEYDFQDIKYLTTEVCYRAELPSSAVLRTADDVARVELHELTKVPRDRLAWPFIGVLLDKLRSSI